MGALRFIAGVLEPSLGGVSRAAAQNFGCCAPSPSRAQLRPERFTRGNPAAYLTTGWPADQADAARLVGDKHVSFEKSGPELYTFSHVPRERELVVPSPTTRSRRRRVSSSIG